MSCENLLSILLLHLCMQLIILCLMVMSIAGSQHVAPRQRFHAVEELGRYLAVFSDLCLTLNKLNGISFVPWGELTIWVIRVMISSLIILLGWAALSVRLRVHSVTRALHVIESLSSAIETLLRRARAGILSCTTKEVWSLCFRDWVCFRHILWVRIPKGASLRLRCTTDSTCELIEEVLGLFEHQGVSGLLVTVLRRIDPDEARAYLGIKTIPLRLESLLELLSLPFGWHWILVLSSQCLFILLTFCFPSPLRVHVEHGKSLINDIIFDPLIKRTISSERSQRIHFDQPGLYLLVQEDIDSQNFKAHWVFDIIRLQRSIGMAELRLRRNQSLDCNIIDLLPQFLNRDLWILFLLFNILKHSWYTPLGACFIICWIFIGLKVLRILVDSIVS